VTDGSDTIAEYDSSNVLQKRYAFDGTGWPLVQYDAAGTRTWMLPDERGSIVALANDTSAMTAINTYDEYGMPGASNAGTFQYASMMWLSRAAVYAPTFRAYAQHLGRFNQTDPIGMAGGINLYAYVANDPVNWLDSPGLNPIVVTACKHGGTPPNCNPPPKPKPSAGVALIGFVQRDMARGSGNRNARTKTRKISKCMQKWLSSHYLGFDWSRPTISSNAPLPYMAASTDSQLMIYVGFKRFDSFETADTFLFFHEIAHMPQWASGELTGLGYVGSTIWNLANHDAIPVELNANTVGKFLSDLYEDEGRPCD
jgi:RHS repeat-associated protein